MYKKWTRDEIRKTKESYAQKPSRDLIGYRFVCGHCIQEDGDADDLNYFIIGVLLVQRRKYSYWAREKSFDLAEILEFMRVYHVKIPKYIRRTKFYRTKKKKLLAILGGVKED